MLPSKEKKQEIHFVEEFGCVLVIVNSGRQTINLIKYYPLFKCLATVFGAFPSMSSYLFLTFHSFASPLQVNIIFFSFN